MIRYLLAALLVPSLALAAEPDSVISSLTSMEGRYTIGPWEGSTQGDRCVLLNSEPLNFAELELSGQQGQGGITLRLTPTIPLRAAGDTISAVVDGGPAEALTYRQDEGALAMQLPASLLEGMNKGSFLHLGSYKYDLRGFAEAHTLLQDCLKKALPAELPAKPLEESEAQEVAAGWQMIVLKLGAYTYARYATLGNGELGVWVHNVDDFVLSLTGVPERESSSIQLNGKAYAVNPQSGGILVALTSEDLRQLEGAGSLAVTYGSYEKSFDIKDFRAVVVALQPYE